MCLLLRHSHTLYTSTDRRSPLDITLCSEISNDPISTIQPVDDATVEIYFRIEDMNNVS